MTMTIIERVSHLVKVIHTISSEYYTTRVKVIEQDGRWTDQDHMDLLRTTENLANQLRSTVKTIEKLNARIEELEAKNN